MTSSNSIDTDEKFIVVGNLKFRDYNKNGKLDIYEDYRKPIEQRAQDLLSKMTMEEKLIQLKCPWVGKAKFFSQNKFDLENAIQAFPKGVGLFFSLSDGSSVLSSNKPPYKRIKGFFANRTSFWRNKTSKFYNYSG